MKIWEPVLYFLLVLATLLTAKHASAESICPTTRVENKTDYWTDQDAITLKRAKTRCGEIYEDSPCLKLFIKKDDYTYNAVCGAPSEK